MIEIDGSYGEGGGALVRISAALSTLTGKSIHITDIRAGRPKKGLMPQHLNALKSVALLSNASCQGLEVGSTEVTFQPGELVGGDFKLDIGTAGSMTLVLQSFLITAAFARDPVKITLSGGSDVRWSPPADYLSNVTLPILKSIGYNIELKLLQRGHYPRGGGVLEAVIHPVKDISPFNLLDLKVDRIRGISHAVKLPEHVALRQAQAAKDALQKAGYQLEIEVQHSDESLSPGSGIVLWTEGEDGTGSSADGELINIRVGSSSIGEPGKRAEVVGKQAADELLYFISGNAALDKYMGDQIIPYMAMAGNSTVKTAELTEHTLTNIYVTEKITGRNFEYEGKLGEPALIRVN